MRPEAPFDIDELFRDADVPEMSVDPAAVLTTGRRARRRRRRTGAAGLAAVTLVAAAALLTTTGPGGTPDANPAGGTSTTTSAPEPSAPGPGEVVALPDLHLPFADPPRTAPATLRYAIATPEHPALDVTPQGQVSVLQVTVRAPGSQGGSQLIAFDPPNRAAESVVSAAQDRSVVVIAPTGSTITLDLAEDADPGEVVSDHVELPGTESSAWVFVTDRAVAEGDVRGATVAHDGRSVHVSSTTAAPGTATIPTVERGESFVGTGGACAESNSCYRPDFTIADVRPGTYGLRCYLNGSPTAFWEKPGVITVTDPSSWSWSSETWCGATAENSTIKVTLFGGPSGTVESDFHPW